MTKDKPKKKQYRRSRADRDVVFYAYAGMGPGRSLAKLAKITGISRDVLESWSRKDEWQIRLKAFEGSMDKQLQQEVIERMTPPLDMVLAIRKKALDNAKERLDAEGSSSKMLDNKLAWEMARTEQGLPVKVTKTENRIENTITPADLEEINKNGIIVRGDEEEEEDGDDVETEEPVDGEE